MDKKKVRQAFRILDEYFAGALPVELQQKIRRWWAGQPYRAEKDLALSRLWDKRVDYDPAPGDYAFDSLARITRRLGFPAQNASESGREEVVPGRKQAAAPLRRMWLRVAAVVVPLLIVGGAGVWIARTMQSGVEVTLVAEADTQEHYTLPDGSQVWINPQGRVTYTEPFKRKRAVTLTGEAFFDVAEMEKRPFTISSEALQVTVYGTRFMVAVPADKDRATVTLHSGSVEVAAGETQTVLVPGEQIQYYPETGEIYVETVELEDWTKPSLDFYAASLDDIFRSLESNFGVTIHTAEPPPAEARYTIRFFARQPVEEVMRILSGLVKTFDYTINENEIEIAFKD